MMMNPSSRNYNGVGSYNNGFQYKIMPLSFNLQQKGNVKKHLDNKCDFCIGDYIYWTDNETEKYYTGIITNIVFDGEDAPVYIYILDNKTRKMICVPYDEAIIAHKHIIEQINNKKSKKIMIESIKLLVEEYMGSTDQMNASIKNQSKESKKADKNYEVRQQFLISILGKATYNKYVNKGTFAPVPLSALHLKLDDFFTMLPENAGIKIKSIEEADLTNTDKVISELRKIYARNEIKFINCGTAYVLHTNIVFKTLDDIIDFFFNIMKAVKKVTKSDKIVWKYLIKKFRDYLK